MDKKMEVKAESFAIERSGSMTDTTTMENKKQSVDKAMHVLRTLPESKRALAIAYMAGMEMRGILDKEEKGA